MSIDLGKLLSEMKSDFNVNDKDFFKWWRESCRHLWGKSNAKKNFVNSKLFMEINKNPRSMKRYPMVKKVKCSLCGEHVSLASAECDHIKGNNQLTKMEHCLPFFEAIVFPKPNELQMACKVCHKIKSHAERKGISFEAAKLDKEFILISKSSELVIDTLKTYGVPLPSTQKARKELLKELMLGEK